VPRGLFDLLASSVFGAVGKRPQLKVRSWLTALLRLSLIQGSMADGLFQHDIVFELPFNLVRRFLSPK
jgi:hypothetical protein